MIGKMSLGGEFEGTKVKNYTKTKRNLMISMFTFCNGFALEEIFTIDRWLDSTDQEVLETGWCDATVKGEYNADLIGVCDPCEADVFTGTRIRHGG